MDHVLSGLKQRDHPVCYQCSVQKPLFLVWGCISVDGTGIFHIWKCAFSGERYIQVLERHMFPLRWHLLLREGRAYYQQNNVKTHTAAINPAWLCSRRSRGAIENIWCIKQRKIDPGLYNHITCIHRGIVCHRPTRGKHIWVFKINWTVERKITACDSPTSLSWKSRFLYKVSCFH